MAAIKSPGCPIAGIGGSAGGFEAAMELLRNLPPGTGMAFVIVQHSIHIMAPGYLIYSAKPHRCR
jgi:chemotaxis response regulator CheB